MPVMESAAPAPEQLRLRLKEPLPGEEAHALMRPHRRPGLLRTIPPEQSHSGAVLILLVPPETQHSRSTVRLPLIERTDDGGPHAGQIALPGGRVEEGDSSIAETALREAREEIGLDPTACRVLGTLTPLHIDVSGFIVTPVVAWYLRPPQKGSNPFRPDPREVRRIISIDPGVLAQSYSVEEVVARGYRFPVPAFRVGQTVIWGATAMILAEFSLLWENSPADPGEVRSSTPAPGPPPAP